MKQTSRPWAVLSFACAAIFLAGCGDHIVPGGFSDVVNGTVRPNGCYVTTVAPKVVRATITFYGWPDNTPPGNAIAHPVIHQVASGAGTYCNPTTFATESANNARIPYGTKIYVTAIKQYFVREDLCAPSGPTSGSGSHGCTKLWFDLWIGGNAHSNFASLIRCERKLTPATKTNVIVDPPDRLAVAHPGPIYRNAPRPGGTCD